MTGVMTREFRRNFTEHIAQPRLSLVEVDHRFRCLASSGAGRWRRNRVASVADFDAGETGLLRVKSDREYGSPAAPVHLHGTRHRAGSMNTHTTGLTGGRRIMSPDTYLLVGAPLNARIFRPITGEPHNGVAYYATILYDRQLSNERSINSGSDGFTRPHQFAPPSPQRER